MMDIKVMLKDGKEYTIENFRSICFGEEKIFIFGTWEYEFDKNEIFVIENAE